MLLLRGPGLDVAPGESRRRLPRRPARGQAHGRYRCPRLHIAVPVAWTPYFAVEDADETAVRIRERSATVAVGPLKFPLGRRALRSPVNRGALAADRDGAVFGIWEGRLIADRHSWRTDAPVWLCLRPPDAFEAASRYVGQRRPRAPPLPTLGTGGCGCGRRRIGEDSPRSAVRRRPNAVRPAARPGPLQAPGTVHFSTSREAKPRPRISFGRHCGPNKRYGRTGVR